MQTTQLRFYIKYLIVGLILGLVIGFFLGRATINVKEEVELVTGETIKGSASAEQFEPVKEEGPKQSQLPTKPVVKENLTTQIVDTAAIIAEYELKRSYSVTAFDNNKYGKLQLYPTLQYNRLVGMDYDYTPIIEKRTVIKRNTWQPFVSASYSTLDFVGFGGGVFYHNLGFEYQYLKGFRDTNNAHLFGLKYKF